MRRSHPNRAVVVICTAWSIQTALYTVLGGYIGSALTVVLFSLLTGLFVWLAAFAWLNPTFPSWKGFKKALDRWRDDKNWDDNDYRGLHD